jgi:capsular polysaccharide biosynthesis protein
LTTTNHISSNSVATGATLPAYAGAIPEEPREIDRVATIWRAKFYIVGAAIVVAALTFGVCLVVPKTYQSSATVRVFLPPSSQASVSSASVTAAGSLAGQYAQTATLSPVLAAAANESGTSEGVLSGSVSAGTISGENLIQVRAEAGSPADAARRANAVATALTNNITLTNAAQAAAYRRAAQKEIAPIDAQIASLRQSILNKPGPQGALLADQGVLGSLMVQRGQLQSTVVQNTTNLPAAEVFATAGPGAKVQPRTVLYTLAALVVAALAAAQIAVALASYRRRSHS